MPSILSRPYAVYSDGSVPSGTELHGNILVGTDLTKDYAGGYGGYTWYMGPDETPGYVLASPNGSVPSFWRSPEKTDSSFLELINSLSARLGSPYFNTLYDAKIWMEAHGSYATGLALQTATNSYLYLYEDANSVFWNYMVLDWNNKSIHGPFVTDIYVSDYYNSTQYSGGFFPNTPLPYYQYGVYPVDQSGYMMIFQENNYFTDSSNHKIAYFVDDKGGFIGKYYADTNNADWGNYINSTYFINRDTGEFFFFYGNGVVHDTINLNLENIIYLDIAGETSNGKLIIFYVIDTGDGNYTQILCYYDRFGYHPIFSQDFTPGATINWAWDIHASSSRLFLRLQTLFDDVWWESELIIYNLTGSSATIDQDVTFTPNTYYGGNTNILWYGTDKTMYVLSDYNNVTDYYLVYNGGNNTYQTASHYGVSGGFDRNFIYSTYYRTQWTDATVSEHIAIVYWQGSYDNTFYGLSEMEVLYFMADGSQDYYTYVTGGDGTVKVMANNWVAVSQGFFFEVDSGNYFISYFTITQDPENRIYTFSNISDRNNLDTSYGGATYGSNTIIARDKILVYHNYINNTGCRFLLFTSNLSDYYDLTTPDGIFDGSRNQEYQAYTISWDTIVVRSYSQEWFFNDDNGSWVQNIPYFSDVYMGTNEYPSNGNGGHGSGMILEFDYRRTFWLNDVSDYNNWSIQVGGNNLFGDWDYAGGNIIQTNLSQNNDGNAVPYTHTQISSGDVDQQYEVNVGFNFAMDGAIVAGDTTNFGDGSSYFTNLYPGLFVLAAYNVNISTFQVVGNLNNGESNRWGFYTTMNFPLETTKASYMVYTLRRGNNSNNHASSDSMIIFIQGTGDGITQTVDNTLSQYEYNQLTGTITGNLHYLLFSEANGSTFTDLEIQNLATAYINVMDNPGNNSLSDSLALLNSASPSSIDSIMSNLPSNRPIVMPARAIARENVCTATIPVPHSLYYNNQTYDISKSWGLTEIVYNDPNNEELFSINRYDNALNLLRVVQTPVDSGNTFGWNSMVLGESGYFGYVQKVMIDGNLIAQDGETMITGDADYATITVPGWNWNGTWQFNDWTWYNNY